MQTRVVHQDLKHFISDTALRAPNIPVPKLYMTQKGGSKGNPKGWNLSRVRLNKTIEII